MRGVFGHSFPVMLGALLAAVAFGCSPEAKANRALETYETVFRACKETTEALKKQPGEDGCSSIASSAVDLGLDQTGLEEPRRSEVLTAWLEKKKFVGYYLPREKRPADK
ncbi:MAG: hypothetical protein IPM54_17040 [Polyangiaceae bacterium]|nr:hypothetical protein [Polyangiaceae bacterium]